MLKLGRVEVSGNYKGGVREVLARLDGDSDLVPAYTFRLGEGRAHLRKNYAYHHFSPGESCPSNPHPETKQFSSSPFVPGAFLDAVPSLELRVSVCEEVSL